jgi:ribosome-binding factor A
MPVDRRKREQMLAHCDDIQADDGIDPREFFKSTPTRGKTGRKVMQLCRQVAETLEQVLSGELGDDELRCLRVMSVVPAPDSSRMLVTLHADCAIDQFDRPRLEEKLASCTGRLRAAVSAAITRRKTPSLTMVVVGPDTDSPIAQREEEH